MTRNQLKQLFRQIIIVVNGGPANVTRGAGLLTGLDALIDSMALTTETGEQTGFTPIAENQYGTHPAAPTLNDALAYLYAEVANGVSVTIPPAPTAAQVDDVANIFSHAVVPGYASASNYELELADVAVGYSTPADVYASSGRIYYPGITGAHSAGSVSARVKASGSRPAGESVSNATAFTGPAADTGTITILDVQGSDSVTITNVVAS